MGALTLDSGSSEESKRQFELNQKLIEMCEMPEVLPNVGCTEIYLQLTGFNPELMLLDGRAWIYPSEDYAIPGASSVQLSTDMDVYIDAARASSGSNEDLYWREFEYARAIDLQLDVPNFDTESKFTDSWYPFDRYSTAISGDVAYKPLSKVGEDVPLADYVPLLTHVSEYTAVLPTWQIEFDYDYVHTEPVFVNEAEYISDAQDGNFYTVIRIERSELTIAIVALIGTIFIGGAFSLILLLRSVLLMHKRSSLTGLVWAGSTTFTLIQTRGLLPGNPRIGIYFDVLIFYPALTACFVVTLILLTKWLKESADSAIPDTEH